MEDNYEIWVKKHDRPDRIVAKGLSQSQALSTVDARNQKAEIEAIEGGDPADFESYYYRVEGSPIYQSYIEFDDHSVRSLQFKHLDQYDKHAGVMRALFDKNGVRARVSYFKVEYNPDTRIAEHGLSRAIDILNAAIREMLHNTLENMAEELLEGAPNNISNVMEEVD